MYSHLKEGSRVKNVKDVTNRCVFSMIRGSWCSKSSLAKAAGAEVAVLADRWKMARRCGAKHICKSKCAKHSNLGPILEVPMFKNGTPLWREAHLQVKMRKTQRSRTYFGSSDVQKWHAAVARSTFASQNAQNTALSELFWKFRCSKMARGCGAKHICKSKCAKHSALGPILEVPMFKNGTRLWREAYL